MSAWGASESVRDMSKSEQEEHKEDRMSSDQNQDEGSQWTQQSRGMSSKASKNRSARGTPKDCSLKGDIEELGGNVCMHGRRGQGDWCIKTTEAIAECVGRECSKEMRLLVKDKKETKFVEPRVPTDKDPDKFAVERHKQQLNRHCNKTQKCEEHKAKVFMIVKGQCSVWQ